MHYNDIQMDNSWHFKNINAPSAIFHWISPHLCRLKIAQSIPKLNISIRLSYCSKETGRFLQVLKFSQMCVLLLWSGTEEYIQVNYCQCIQ
jgi:hypothetical protein